MGDSPSKRAHRLHPYLPESQVTGGREVGQQEGPHNRGSQQAGGWGVPTSEAFLPCCCSWGSASERREGGMNPAVNPAAVLQLGSPHSMQNAQPN